MESVERTVQRTRSLLIGQLIRLENLKPLIWCCPVCMFHQLFVVFDQKKWYQGFRLEHLGCAVAMVWIWPVALCYMLSTFFSINFLPISHCSATVKANISVAFHATCKIMQNLVSSAAPCGLNAILHVLFCATLFLFSQLQSSLFCGLLRTQLALRASTFIVEVLTVTNSNTGCIENIFCIAT